ncbi:MAG: toll/interleukin-1 receptor domain-containing protein [Acidobacteriota bacterium]|nr:toll/interleukin-1 receptor domain-containing protein [Acidobacteriota bacterium]
MEIIEADREWDVFISHASEDKDSFVRPLAVALNQLGVNVWYDEFSLGLGDSISRSIDKGLAKSKYGLVVISEAFIRKKWPEYELRGLVAREIDEEKVIIPIWHGVSREQVMMFSPPLADKMALNTGSTSAQDVAIQILKVIRPDIYKKHPRSHLEKMSSGKALGELQGEIERMKGELEHTQGELSQYRCPYCNAQIVGQGHIDTGDKHEQWELVQAFECGYEVIGGELTYPCPSDPKFPKLEDYELVTQYLEPLDAWRCTPRPKTDMARMVPLPLLYDHNEEGVKARVIDEYKRKAKRLVD